MNSTFKKSLFVALLTLLYFFNVFGRFYGNYLNFIITGILNFIFIFYLLKINPFKKIGLILIFFPFALLTGIVIYGLVNTLKMPGLIGYYMYCLSTVFGIWLFVARNKILVILTYTLIYLSSVYLYPDLINYYNTQVNQSDNVGKALPKITIENLNGNKTELLTNGKILFVDLWSNSCANCITAFPKFENLKNDFKDDKEIEFIAINVYNKRNDIAESRKFLEEFTFANYYTDETIFKLLDFNTFPHYMLIGKDGKIKYFGSLNVGEFENYNNAYKLIKNEK